MQERTADLIKSNVELDKTNTKLSAIINHSADGIITVSKDWAKLSDLSLLKDRKW